MLGLRSTLTCLLTLVPSTALSQNGPDRTSAPITEVRYELTFDRSTAAQRELHVRMRFRTPGTDAVLLSLPAWTPGAYELSNFARKVIGFSAETDNRPLQWEKVDFDTWRVIPRGAQTITVQFRYRADSLDNAMAWSTDDFLLVNGTNVFLYPEGRNLDFPSGVTVATEADWRVATGLTSTGPRQYSATDYHELVDMPMFVGRIDVDSQRVGGKWYRLASHPAGAMTGEPRATLWRQIQQMVPPMATVFGETPWDTYTTLLVFRDGYPGGSALEHANSHVGIYQPEFIGHELLASITAHEIFHAWNVKRLRPQDMVPYDYSRPQPTPLLWMSEGITDYYADLALVRGNIISPAVFYQLTAGKIDEVANGPPVALEDASLTTWISPIDGTHYTYYSKGSLAGLLIDILIRDGSNNRASLDDVLRRLYQQAYKSQRGFTTEQFWTIVRELAGASVDDFHARYIDGREEFPYTRVLPLAGLRLVADSARVPRVGITTSADSLGIRVGAIEPGSYAAEAGVRQDDYVLRLGGLDVDSPFFGETFRRQFANAVEGTPLDIVVQRGAERLTLSARLRFAQTVSYTIREAPTASPKAVRIREGILQGNR